MWKTAGSQEEGVRGVSHCRARALFSLIVFMGMMIKWLEILCGVYFLRFIYMYIHTCIHICIYIIFIAASIKRTNFMHSTSTIPRRQPYFSFSLPASISSLLPLSSFHRFLQRQNFYLFFIHKSNSPLSIVFNSKMYECHLHRNNTSCTEVYKQGLKTTTKSHNVRFIPVHF